MLNLIYLENKIQHFLHIIYLRDHLHEMSNPVLRGKIRIISPISRGITYIIYNSEKDYRLVRHPQPPDHQSDTHPNEPQRPAAKGDTQYQIVIFYRSN